jgi:hypothetical protein
LRPQDDGEFVSQRGLASGGNPVDSDPRRVRDLDGPDRLGQASEQFVTGAVFDIPPQLEILYTDSTTPIFSRSASAAVPAPVAGAGTAPAPPGDSYPGVAVCS